MTRGLRLEINQLPFAEPVCYEYRVSFYAGKEFYQGVGTALDANQCFDKAMAYVEETQNAIQS